jgi:hypothetical protein
MHWITLQALALGLCLGRPDLYRRHRTLIASTSHALGVVISDVYYSLWAADADLSDPGTFRMVALWAGGNYIAPAYWWAAKLLSVLCILLRAGILFFTMEVSMRCCQECKCYMKA